MKKILSLMLALSVGGLCFTSCGDDDDDKIKLPDSFSQALETKYPGYARKAKWGREGAYYVAEFRNDQRHDVDVWFNGDATWAMTQTDYEANPMMLPNEVTIAYEATDYAGSWTIDDIDFYERPDINFYVIEIDKKGAPDRELYYKPDGTLIKDIVATDIDILPTTPID